MVRNIVVLIHILDKKADEAQFLLSSSPNSTSASLQTVNGSKKRLASASSPSLVAQDASQPKKPKIDQDAKVGDGQNSKSKKLVISVDEYCPGSYEVYIDDDGTIMDASLNQTNASANNNKFYKVQVYHPSSHFVSYKLLTDYSWCAMVHVQTSKHMHDGVEWANVARVPCSVMDH
jgi:poly [ADP-ribose] polymerase